MAKSSKKEGLVVQAGILAAAGIISRIIGMLYGAPLTAIIGDEGNGYYASAYNLYTIVLLVSSYSIPSAISKVMAQRLAIKEYKNAQRIFSCALIYVAIVGGIGSLLLFFLAPFFVKSSSVMVVRVFAPTVFVYGFLGVLRGYFQAHRSMAQTSISQIMEQILNAVVSLGAAHYLMQMVADKDTTTQAIYGAIGSALGTGSGVLIALLFMLWIYYINRGTINKRQQKDKHENVESYATIFKEIFFIVTPFILSTFIYNSTTFINQTIYTNICVDIHGMDVKSVLIDYGIFNKKAMVMVNIPIALATAMSAAIMPTVSAALAKGDRDAAKSKVHTAIRTTMLISIPSAAGLMSLAKPVLWLLFPQKASIDLASDLLRILAITVVFYGLSTLTMAILQACGRVNAPVIHSAIALVVQSGVLIALLYYTELGVYALPIASIVYSLLMCIMNGLSIARILQYKQEQDLTFYRPAVCAIIMGVASYFVYEGAYYLIGISAVSLLIALVTAIPLYFALLFKIKGLTEEDISAMPKGTKILKVLKKLHIIKTPKEIVDEKVTQPELSLQEQEK